MLDTQTKRRIDDCRDILVGKLPDPKAQIEQITIGLIYKFMDDMDKEAIELGGQAKFFSDYKVPDPEFPNDRSKDKVIAFSKYAWHNLMHPKVTAAEMLTRYSEAIEGMEKNPNIPQLFRDIFNNAYLPYRDPETLKLFLKTIGEFEYTHSEKLGDAFEYLLSVMGSQGDAGQFRTPRHIIDFLVAIIDPDINDTILDPACGTAGFLISAYKHILLKHTRVNNEGLNIYQYNKLEKKPFNNLGDQLTPDERKKLIQNFVGYDISPDMVRLSLVNLYLHGFNTPNIHEYDTLSSEERWNESYDVILANPPFMSPKGGIRPHKKFTISSNRSEVLFVDYIAEHLNLKGKAGIIVPEGIIFQSGTAYKELRKMLVENYLYAVVSLPAGIFNPYSGVKTSILLMDKEVSKKQNEILFIKIDNDGFNLGAQRTAVKGSQLEEAIALIKAYSHPELVSGSGSVAEMLKQVQHDNSHIAHLVPKTEIAKNGDYYLSGERYKVIQTAISDFDFVNLSQVAELQGGYAFKSSELKKNKKNNDLPVIKIGHIKRDGHVELSDLQYFPYNDSLRRYLIGKKDILLAMTGATVGKVAVSEFDNLLLNQRVGLIRSKSEKLSSAYLSNLLLHEKFYDYCQRTAGGGAQGNISPKEILNFQIPLPPLSIQEEIVAEIEGYQKIIDGAKAVVANYKPKIDIDPDWEMVELGEVIKLSSGKGLTSRDMIEGPFPVYGGNGINGFHNEYFLEESTIVIGRVGAYCGAVHITEPKTWITDNGLYVTTFLREMELKYLAQLLTQLNLNRFAKVGGQPSISQKTVTELSISAPPLEIQKQIVARIEKEQELVNANKQLIEIFEQKIKDRIARVWGGSASLSTGEEKKDEQAFSFAAEPQGGYESSGLS